MDEAPKIEAHNNPLVLANCVIRSNPKPMVSIGFLEIFLAAIGLVILWSLASKNGLPRNWPILGMLPHAFLHHHRPHQRLTEILERTGCTFLFIGPWFTNFEMIVTADPANIHHIMSSNFKNFPKGHHFLKMFDILGDGIFNADSDLWKNQRKLAQLLLNHRRFHRFLVKTSRHKVEKGLIPMLEHATEHGSVLDFQDLFQRYTFDVTCMLVTGYDPKCLSLDFPEVPFANALDDAEEAIYYRHIWPVCFWKLQRRLGIGEEKKLKNAWETIDRVVAEYLLRKRSELSDKKHINPTQDVDDDEDQGVDLLTSYMGEDEIMGLKTDDKFLRDTVVNLMLAGRDTTSAGLSWFFWLLSQNPHVESKIREELLKSIIPGKEGAENWRLFEAEELKDLVYLHGALCEALRLYPPVPFQHKEPHQEDVLPSGHPVNPKKTRVIFSLYAMGRMSSIWGKDCLEFKPERWISESGRIKHEPSYKFLAFNAGPRTCLGKEVAFTQMKAVAAAVIHNYQVKAVEGHIVSPGSSVILHMKDGFKVSVNKRWV